MESEPMRALCLLLGLLGNAMALTMARPFAPHMVLPMDRPIPVWGEAQPGALVEVRFHGQKAQARADAKGSWKVMLPAQRASHDGAELEVVSGNERVVMGDVLVGRVLLFSGQSNMDFPLAKAVGGKAAAAKAGSFPAIRLCSWTGAPTDGRLYDATVLSRLNTKDHFVGTWKTASAETAGEISAIAWWTAQILHEQSQVPIGVVENAVGGSCTEAWLPWEALAARKAYVDLTGEHWFDSARFSPWARGRVKQNLGPQLQANHPFKPGFLFESGVRPWAGFPFDGVVWYQGETNAEVHDDAWHAQVISDLAAAWRKVLGNDKLPFHLVQLPRIGGSDPLRKYWPEYRAVQAKVAQRTPGVHLVVTQDLGWDSPDVHPPDKLPVARRVAEAILSAHGK